MDTSINDSSNTSTDDSPDELELYQNTIGRLNAYMEWGFVPIPIRSIESDKYDNNLIGNGKAPMIKNWTNVTSDKSPQLVLWGCRKTKSNINLGIICGPSSKCVVLDIDMKDFGMYHWEKLIKLHPPINTFTVHTGNGGLHYYFKFDRASMMVTTCTRLKVGGVSIGFDVRSTGSQVLGPGSTHPITGKEYIPINGFEGTWSKDDPGDIIPIITSIPLWLCDILIRPSAIPHNVIEVPLEEAYKYHPPTVKVIEFTL